MEVFTFSRKLSNTDVNMHMQLKTSALFALLQEAASEHCIKLGFGPEYTAPRGLLWVITRQKAEIYRLPRYEETVIIETWPGPTKHVIFPRYYQIKDLQGNIIIKASSVWTLINGETRSLAVSGHGVDLTGSLSGEGISLPRAPSPIEFGQEYNFTVPYSYVDINGHMNNTKYFDLAEDLIPSPAAGDQLSRVCVEYSSEARLGDEVKVRIGSNERSYYVYGEASKTIFKISLEYSDKNN